MRLFSRGRIGPVLTICLFITVLVTWRGHLSLFKTTRSTHERTGIGGDDGIRHIQEVFETNGIQETEKTTEAQVTEEDFAENTVSQSLKCLTRHVLRDLKVTNTNNLLPTCNNVEKRNFVYIKNHKCGSDTVSAIFRRFGYTRNLSMVLTKQYHWNLGWPYPLEPKMYRASKDQGGFNILCEHTIYNKSYMEELMPRDSVYITSLREPFSRMRSAFFFFGMEKITNLTFVTQNQNKQIELFMRSPQHYDDLYKRPKPRVVRPCVPDHLSSTRNAMAFDLGFPTGFHPGTTDQQTNITFIREWLQQIDRDFQLIVLLEYFEESLIMMKRMVCWSWKDILYKRLNRNKSIKTKLKNDLSADLIDNYHLWSFVDYILHKHFKRVFWRRISAMGSEDFMEEVEAFKIALDTVLEFCEDTNSTESVHIAASKWDRGFSVDRAYCELIMSDVRDQLRMQYDNNPVSVEQVPGKVPNC